MTRTVETGPKKTRKTRQLVNDIIMKLLSLETSTKNFSLAVSDGTKILAKRNMRLTGVLSSSIIPGIQHILKRSGLILKDIDGLAVGLGPGSFTSLRVGLSTIKAMAMATRKPVVGISSLDALAMNAPYAINDQICTICDARRNWVYAAFYERSGSTLERRGDYFLGTIDDLFVKIKESTFLIGDAIPLFEEQIKRLSVEKKKQIPLVNIRLSDHEKDWFPQASRLALLALPRFLKNETDDIYTIVPLYLFPEDCQIQR